MAKLIFFSLLSILILRLSCSVLADCYNDADCSGHGQCVFRPPVEVCECDEGWLGTYCNIQECTSSTCSDHGTCNYGANYVPICTCFYPWGGSTCNSVLKLPDWCDSIVKKSIDNNFIDDTTTEINVPCDGTYHTTFSTAESTRIGSSILEDLNSLPNDAELQGYLYEFWSVHPYIRDTCCFHESLNYKSVLRKLLSFNDTFHKYYRILTAQNLRLEMDSVCQLNPVDSFCLPDIVTEELSKIASLPESILAWSEEHKQRSVLITLRFILSPLSCHLLTDKEITETIIALCNFMLRYIEMKDATNLKSLFSQLPAMTEIPNNEVPCKGDVCLLKKIIEQFKLYVAELHRYENPIFVNGSRRAILNTALDYQSFFEQKQLDRVLQTLSEHHVTSLAIANELKEHITDSFSDLRSYYESIASFNQNIANSDIQYVQGKLISLQDKLDEVVKSFKGNMTTLIVNLLGAGAAEVLQETVELALTYVQHSNPFGWLSGASSGKELLDAATELLDAIKDLIVAGILAGTWTSVMHDAKEIKNKFDKNEEFLSSMKSLILEEQDSFEESKNIFLDKYAAYDPQVTVDDLIKLNGLWGQLAEQACSILDGFDTAAAIPFQTYIESDRTCQKLAVLTERMGSLHSIIYESQFELIDVMVDYLRSAVTLSAAKEINNEFEALAVVDPDSDKTLETLQLMGTLTYITYKTHILAAVIEYCDILEYKMGGVKPKACEGPNTDLSLLVATIVPDCISQSEDIYFVPVGNDDGILTGADMVSLFAGGKIGFQVPSSQWLIDKGWITEEEKDYAFYVRDLAVYLPTQSKHPRRIIVNAEVVSENILHLMSCPYDNCTSTEYTLMPYRPLVNEYILGPPRTFCKYSKISNPYMSCEKEYSSVICPLSDKQDEIKELFPSIYSKWSISVSGFKYLTPPNPATNMSLIFGMNLCKLPPADLTSEFRSRYSRSLVTSEYQECCPTGQFRPSIKSDCTNCPTNSTSALAGYYCEVNT